jgi:hypothetical protein
MGVWGRTCVQFPPQRCIGDGSTLMLLPDIQQHGSRQGCKAGNLSARLSHPVSQVAMGRNTPVLQNRR